VIDASNSNLAKKKLRCWGAPNRYRGRHNGGTLMGPAALRTAGLLTLLDGLGFEVRDHGRSFNWRCGRPGRRSA